MLHRELLRCSRAGSLELSKIDSTVTVEVSLIEHCLELFPGLFWKWWEAVLLSKGNDGIMSFLFGDGFFTGGQLLDNPVLDFLLLFWSEVFPFLLHELFSMDSVEGVLHLSLLDCREKDVMLGHSGSSGDSDEGKKVEEFHLCFCLSFVFIYY